jgi:hypothetical protein
MRLLSAIGAFDEQPRGELQISVLTRTIWCWQQRLSHPVLVVYKAALELSPLGRFPRKSLAECRMTEYLYTSVLLLI